MTVEDDVRLIRRLAADVYTQGNLAVAEACYAATVQVNGQPISVAELTDALGCLHGALPGLQVTISAPRPVGGWVAVQWTLHWTAAQPGGSSHADARPGGATSLRLFRLVAGKITDVWISWAGDHDWDAGDAVQLHDQLRASI